MPTTLERLVSDATMQAILTQLTQQTGYLGSLVGEDKTQLSTSAKASFVAAINEIVSFSKALKEGTGAGLHNGIYRGKYLGTSVTAAQWAAIAAGTFDDLWIGDYWTINGVNWRIADFDYWLHSGDTECTTHHIVIVPDQTLYNAQMHNTTSGGYESGAANTTEGGYVGSDMYTTNLAQAKAIINNAFGSAHILNHRMYLQNAVSSGRPSGGAWYDSTVELMTEQMVYGGKIFGAACDGTTVPYLHTVEKSQLSLFRLCHEKTIATKLADGTRMWWWLRDVVSAANFAAVATGGRADYGGASSAGGVRPAFAVRAAA